jgi:TRAP-type mannitol/chloroaromatic compound transport system permease small subunit
MSPADFAAIAGPGLTIALGALAPFLLAPFAILLSGKFSAEIAAPLTQIVEFASLWSNRIAQVMLAAMALIVGAVVILRYGFGFSSNLLQESATYAHAFAFLLAAPAALARDGHVRVDVFYAKFSPHQKALVNLCAYALLAAPMLLAILHFSGPYVAASWRIAERSAEADGLPILYLLKTAIPIFAILLLAQALCEACRAACLLRGIEPAPTRFNPEEERPG